MPHDNTLCRIQYSRYLSESGSTDGASAQRVKILEVLTHSDPIAVDPLLQPCQ